MSYKLSRDNLVLRLSDGATLPCRFKNSNVIPLDEHSPFVKEFQVWLAQGNTPQAADPEPTPVRVQSLSERVMIAKGLATRADFDAKANE